MDRRFTRGAQAVDRCSDRIDRDLRFAADYRGRGSTERPDRHVWRVPEIEPPVLVVFDVSTDDRMVYVLQILLVSA